MNTVGIGDASDNDTFLTTDWAKAKDGGCTFGVVRATTTGAWVNGKPGMREDTRFKANTLAMIGLGLERYSYCWFDPRPQLNGEEQAVFYMQAVQKLGVGPGLNAVIDVEPVPATLTNKAIVYTAGSILRLRAWLEMVDLTGWKCAIYSYPTFIDQLAQMADISWMKKYDWMVAHWDVPVPRDPWPWFPGGHKIWQTTARMPGYRYGFYGKTIPGASPNICMAVKEV